MVKQFVYIVILVLSAVVTQSCTAYKKTAYLMDAEKIPRERLRQSAGVYEAQIMPKDVLSILVTSETPGAAADFNMSVPYKKNTIAQEESYDNISETTYIVDADGYINFPVLGRLKLGGLTKKEASRLIYSLIYPDYLTEKPIVDIRFLNFSVTVLGEVARPGIYKSNNEQMTIFEALAAAGDMTIYGKRNNVLLVRANENGELIPRRINLQDKNILLNKDVYYLQQNDMIYVEIIRSKSNSRSFGMAESTFMSVLSLLVSIASVVLYYKIYNDK